MESISRKNNGIAGKGIPVLVICWIGLSVVMLVVGSIAHFVAMKIFGVLLIAALFVMIVILMILRSRDKSYSKKQVLKIRETIGEYRNTPMQVLSAQTGIERGELLNEMKRLVGRGLLDDGHIDYKTQEWITEKNIEERKTGFRFGTFMDSKSSNAYCSYCGDLLEKGAVYCVTCGHKVFDPIIPDQKEWYMAVIDSFEEIAKDKSMKKKAHKLRKAISKMYDRIEKNPAEAVDIQSFLDFYLPKIIKVIDSYTDIVNNGVDDPRVYELEEQLEKSLDNYTSSVEEALRQTYKDDLMDTLTDMDALEQALIQEGLLDDNRSMF